MSDTLAREATPGRSGLDYIAIEAEYGASNYKPLDVVLTRGESAYVWDVDGNRYLDCFAAYSAVNQGHCHPKILAALTAQAARLTLTSRALRNDQLAPFYAELCALTRSHKVLPMNSGAEAVESALKVARKWGYEVKGRGTGAGRDHRLQRQLSWPHARHRSATGNVLPRWPHVATFAGMTTVSIREAKNRLTELARRVEQGETVVVTRNGRPVLDLVPHRTSGGLDLAAGEAYLRGKGIAGALVPYIAPDFDEPLPDDFLLRPLPR